MDSRLKYRIPIIVDYNDAQAFKIISVSRMQLLFEKLDGNLLQLISLIYSKVDKKSQEDDSNWRERHLCKNLEECSNI